MYSQRFMYYDAYYIVIYMSETENNINVHQKVVNKINYGILYDL